MTVKSKIMLLEKNLKWRNGSTYRTATLKAAALLVYFTFGFITGCARVFDNISPFGVAMTSCCGGGAGGFVGLLGAAFGYVISGNPLWSVRYLAALVLVFTVSFVFRAHSLMDREWFMPIVSGVLLIISGALCYYDTLQKVSKNAL